MADPFGCDRLYSLFDLAMAIDDYFDSIPAVYMMLAVEEWQDPQVGFSHPLTPPAPIEHPAGIWRDRKKALAAAPLFIRKNMNEATSKHLESPPEKQKDLPPELRKRSTPDETQFQWYRRIIKWERASNVYAVDATLVSDATLDRMAAEWACDIGAFTVLEEDLFRFEALYRATKAAGLALPLIYLRILPPSKAQPGQWLADMQGTMYPPHHRGTVPLYPPELPVIHRFAEWTRDTAEAIVAQAEAVATIHLAYWSRETAKAIDREEERLGFAAPPHGWSGFFDPSIILGDEAAPPLEDGNAEAILLVLKQRQAVNLLHRLRREDIARQMDTPLETIRPYLQSLKMKGCIETKLGAGGGCWITPTGLEALNKSVKPASE